MFKIRKIPQSKLPESLQQQIYQDQGNHYQKHDRYDAAIEAYKKSLELNAKNAQSACKLAQSQLIVVEPSEAFNGLISNGKETVNHFDSNLTGCDCLYDLNDFEKNMLFISQMARSTEKTSPNHHQLNRAEVLEERFRTVSKNFESMIGASAGNCMFDKKALMNRLQEKFKKSEETPSTSSWKEMKEKGECDAASVLNLKLEEKKSLQEERRLMKVNKYFSQVFLKEASEDYEYIALLMRDPVLLRSTQNSESFDAIQDSLKSCNKSCSNLISRLHARCPMYAYKTQMFPNKAAQKKYESTLLSRIQEQTTRDMIHQLEKIKKLRTRGDLKKMVSFVEHVLGKYYQARSEKEMHGKNEFINMICHLVGVAHVDQLKLPHNLEKLPISEKLPKIFSTTVLDRDAPVLNTFGDIRTYRAAGVPDPLFLIFKRKISYLEDRLSRSTLNIEKCHLYHEMAKQNLSQCKFDEARTFGKKIIEESKDFKELVWRFLGHVIQIKADIMQVNRVKISEDLLAAKEVAYEMGNEQLIKLIKTSIKIAEDPFLSSKFQLQV